MPKRFTDSSTRTTRGGDRSSTTSDAYFEWLTSKIELDQKRTYKRLLELMHEKEFVWIVPNDDNRIVDGLDLRVEFLHENNVFDLPVETLGPCSVLEVVVALSRRIAFIAGGSAEGWAWQLLVNLELDRLSDPLPRRRENKANEILDALIWRNYQPDGTGGFFPLAWPDEDQTRIEIWYQMNSYVGEMHPEY